MIQRIQSLYLLLTAICYAVIMFLPLALINGKVSYSVWSLTDANGIILTQTYYLGLIAIIIVFLSIIAIFLYRKRMVQNKFCAALFVFIFIFMALFFFIYPEFVIKKEWGNDVLIKYSFYSIIAVLPIVFIWLANRGIIKDERLIRSADRLR